MEQTVAYRMIVDSVLIVVIMAVLAWIEARRRNGSVVGGQRGDPMVRRQSAQRLGEPSARWMRRPAPQKSGMKLVLATIIGLAITAVATTASAHVVEITTSIPAAKAADDADLKEALEAAIDDAVKHAIGFTPTLITLQDARLVGGRIYIVLLVVDERGEDLIKQLEADAANSSSESLTDPREHDPKSL